MPVENILLKEFYKLFIETFNPKLDTIYYPCCGIDTTASVVFDARNIYVDNNPACIETLEKEGLEAHLADADDLKIKGGVDAIIFLNQYMSIENALANLNDQGYVICNDYRGAATQIREIAEYNLLGVCRKHEERIFFDETDLDDFFKQVETDEEFKKAIWGVLNYNHAADIVRCINGRTENIVEEYNKLIDIAVKERQAFFDKKGCNVKVSPHHPLSHKGIMLYSLPRKKGNVVDLFVFRKD
jgi:hypothetical protein